jgi:hypothetical protein
VRDGDRVSVEIAGSDHVVSVTAAEGQRIPIGDDRATASIGAAVARARPGDRVGRPAPRSAGEAPRPGQLTGCRANRVGHGTAGGFPSRHATAYARAMAARPFRVRADRVWRLPSGVGVRLDAVLRAGETVELGDGTSVEGPAALVHATQRDAVLVDGWIAVGETVELGVDRYVLRRVSNVGVLNAAMTNADYGLAPMPVRQPGRVATFAPA